MNRKHNMYGTSTYYAWQNLKRSSGGVCLSWRRFENFLTDVGKKPSHKYWLFKKRAIQRSRKGNVEWKQYKRKLQPIWLYLSQPEIDTCKTHIKIVCKRGGYDIDIAMDEFYKMHLEGVKNPFTRAHSFIKRYLPKTMARIKKKRGIHLPIMEDLI